MVLRDTSTVEDIITSANGGGNAVVEVTVVTRHEESPFVGSHDAEQGDQKERVFHSSQKEL